MVWITLISTHRGHTLSRRRWAPAVLPAAPSWRVSAGSLDHDRGTTARTCKSSWLMSGLLTLYISKVLNYSWSNILHFYRGHLYSLQSIKNGISQARHSHIHTTHSQSVCLENIFQLNKNISTPRLESDSGHWTCTNSRNLNCMPGEIFSTGASFCAEGCNVMTRGDTGHVDTCHAWSVVTRGL